VLERQPAGFPLERFDDRHFGRVVADVKDHLSDGPGILLAGFDDPLTEWMRQTVEEIAHNIGLRLGDHMIPTGPHRVEWWLIQVKRWGLVVK
jgi:hypothetical protein